MEAQDDVKGQTKHSWMDKLRKGMHLCLNRSANENWCQSRCELQDPAFVQNKFWKKEGEASRLPSIGNNEKRRRNKDSRMWSDSLEDSRSYHNILYCQKHFAIYDYDLLKSAVPNPK